MPDQKISQLTGGGAAQATDELPIARAGANFKITGANVAAAATSVGTLTSLVVSGNVTVDTTTLVVDATNDRVGIGTASPAARLHVRGGAAVSGGFTGYGNGAILESSATAGGNLDIVTDRTSVGSVSFTDQDGAGRGLVEYSHSLDRLRLAAVDNIRFDTASSERMRLDSSGNLGLGVTPSAWGTGSSQRSLDVGAYGSFATWNNATGVVNNAYLATGGSWVYRNTAAASFYYQVSGSHVWQTAPSGTAGNTPTFTTAMTLDASAYLGVGTTSSSVRLTLGKTTDAEDVNILRVYRGGSVNQYADFSSQAGVATIASQNGAGGAFVFKGDGTERARITSGGYFKASNSGTYAGSTGTYHELRSNENNTVLYLSNTNAAYTNDLVFIDTTTAAGTGFDFFDVRGNNVGQFRVRGDGTIYAQNTTVQSISDARLKENVSDATDGLNVITALRPVRYDWKTGYGNDRTNQLGFIAQEVEPVFPEAVSEWDINDKTYKTVGPAALIPVLVKAIQELNTRLKALEA